MSSRTPNQDKALAWYIQAHNLLPTATSAHPVYNFVEKMGGGVIKENIVNITAQWERYRKLKKNI